MGDKLLMGNTISELYSNDPWVRDFMEEVYDMFGVPRGTDDCLSREDKILFVWGMMSLVQAMKKDEYWLELKEHLDPEDAARKYVQNHYEETGILILENVGPEEELYTKVNGDDR